MICFYADRASHIRSSESTRDTVEVEYPTHEEVGDQHSKWKKRLQSLCIPRAV